MTRYKKKPLIVDAIQYTGDNKKEIIDFSSEIIRTNTCYSYLSIPTGRGNLKIHVGDWVIKGIVGEIYSCIPEIFDQTYEQYEFLI